MSKHFYDFPKLTTEKYLISELTQDNAYKKIMKSTDMSIACLFHYPAERDLPPHLSVITVARGVLEIIKNRILYDEK